VTTDQTSISHTFRVRYAETDAMGIVHHSSFVVWLEMGRTEFMRAHGFTYRELEKMGVLLPVVELSIRYRQPAYYDDELQITTWVEELTRTRIKMAYKVERKGDNTLLVEANTAHTFMAPGGRLLRITHNKEAWDKLSSMAPQLLEGEP
jgi:acyl-CoA thioester hydrolase